MIKFLHTADIHLDSPLKGLEVHEEAPLEELRGATRRAFDKLIELALEKEVSFILIAGDLYDGDWKDYNTGLFFASRMGRLDQAGIKVFIVSGNHDAASQITKTMPLPDNVVLFSSKQPQSVKLDEIDFAIHGQSYSSRAVTDNLAEKYPPCDPNYFNIGLLHTSLTGREGHENYVPCSPDDLISKGYDYWALGHIHKREVVCKDPMIIFPGNLQGRHIKETGAKSATLVTVDNGRISAVEECELDVLRWSLCHLDLTGCECKETLYEMVRSALEKERSLAGNKTLALRLLLEGSCPVHAELHVQSLQISEEIRGIAASLESIWLEKIKFRTSHNLNREELTGGNNPLSELLAAVDKLDSDASVLTTLTHNLANLKAKLPAELIDETFSPESRPHKSGELQSEVKELLIAKLIQLGGAT